MKKKLGEKRTMTWKTGEKVGEEVNVWLLRSNSLIKKYYIKLNDGGFGWRTQFEGSLKEAREYVRNTFC